MIEFQDSDIIILSPYTYKGYEDGIYFKIHDPVWSMSVIGDDYKVLLNRSDYTLIETNNEYYREKYLAIESLLTGDVLILGAGLQILDTYLTTGSSWKWVEKNAYLASFNPVNGTIHEGNAEDEAFLATLGTFDTILLDFKKTKLVDYDSLLNIGGSIVEMVI